MAFAAAGVIQLSIARSQAGHRGFESHCPISSFLKRDLATIVSSRMREFGSGRAPRPAFLAWKRRTHECVSET